MAPHDPEQTSLDHPMDDSNAHEAEQTVHDHDAPVENEVRHEAEQTMHDGDVVDTHEAEQTMHDGDVVDMHEAEQTMHDGDLPRRVQEKAQRNHDSNAKADSQSSDSDSAKVDPKLIQETKNQIRQLVQEVTELSQSDCSEEDFWDEYLNRVVSALASAGGAIWTVNDNGGLDLDYQINIGQTGLPESSEAQLRHAMLLKKVLSGGESTIAAPQSGGGADEAGNPTDYLLVLGVVTCKGNVRAIVEIFQRPGGGPTTHRGYLRFLGQMCDLAADYLKNHQLKNYDDRQVLWDQLDEFLRRVYRGLDLNETVFTIANEGRRVIDCDRVSLALRKGGSCKVEAVSGLDTFDRRADEIKRLGKLATVAIKAQQDLWYRGDGADLPPQIEKQLHRYLDKSHAKTLAVLPLWRPSDEEDSQQRPKSDLLGALIVEQLTEKPEGDAFDRRAEVVAEHSGAALANSLEHNSLFLLPLWKALGKSTALLKAGNLAKFTFAGAVLAAIAIALVIIPYDFELSSSGQLRPEARQEVFAGIDGKVVGVAVNEGSEVKEGQELARLRNAELEVDVTRLRGRRRTIDEQITSKQRQLLEGQGLSVQEQNQLEGELAELTKNADNIDRELALFREKQQHLVVRSPRDGQIVTWRVRDKVLHRPVQRGQSLMTVVDPDSPWELELFVPEKRMGHITAARRHAEKTAKPVQVTFVLATNPDRQFVGHVTAIDQAAQVHNEDGNTVRIRVSIDDEELPELRDGAKVTAKVHCGQQPLGYVIFQDLIETVQAKVLFWF